MGKASCGRQERLSGAVCTLPFDHTGEHKDLTDWRVLVYFGDEKEEPLIVPGDTDFHRWRDFWTNLD